MPKKPPPSIGGRLKAARLAAGWTQERLSEASGVRQGNISAAEKEASNPSAVLLAKLARALGVSLDSLVP